MTLTKDPSQRSSKQVNPKKNKTRKKSLVNQPKIQLLDNDKELIAKYLEDNKHLAIPSKTEAITTKGIIEAIGQNAEETYLQNQVTEILKSWGWIKKQKRINGQPTRVWSNPSFLSDSKGGDTEGVTGGVTSDSKGGVTEGVTEDKKLENTSIQSLSHPPHKPTESPQISPATKPVIEDEVVDRYLPYGEEDIKQVRETLLTHVMCDYDLDLAGVYRDWENKFGLGLFEKACETLPTMTVNKLQGLVSQVDAVARRYKTRSDKYEILQDIEPEYTFDVYGVSLEVKDKVKPYDELPNGEGRPLGEVIKIEKCNETIKVVVQWENGRTSEYFGESKIETEGSYEVNIKELRKMTCENGQWVVATL